MSTISDGLMREFWEKVSKGEILEAQFLAFLKNLSRFTPEPDADGWYSIEVDGDAYQGPLDSQKYHSCMEATVRDFPVQSGTWTIRYKFLEFNHNPTTQEVMDRVEQEGVRMPDRAETNTVLDHHAAEIVGICGRSSGGVVGYVNQLSDGRVLSLFSLRLRIGVCCRFLVVARD